MAEQRVVTPEAVPLEFPLASIGSRFLALLIDWGIQLAALIAILFAGGVATNAMGVADHGVVIALTFLVVFALILGYPVAFETLRRGRTPGKAALGLRVVTREGAPEGFRHAAVRAALGLVDFALTMGAGAVLSVLFTRDSQRLGDLVAGTLVVRERTGLPAPLPVSFSVPAGLGAYAATLDVAGLGTADYSTVRSFLLRARTLPEEARARIAASLAATVASRLRTTPPPDVSPEVFLQCVAAAMQARQPAVRAYPPPPPPAMPAGAPPPAAPVVRPPGPPPAGSPPPGGGFVPPS